MCCTSFQNKNDSRLGPEGIVSFGRGITLDESLFVVPLFGFHVFSSLPESGRNKTLLNNSNPAVLNWMTDGVFKSFTLKKLECSKQATSKECLEYH